MMTENPAVDLAILIPMEGRTVKQLADNLCMIYNMRGIPHRVTAMEGCAALELMSMDMTRAMIIAATVGAHVALLCRCESGCY